MSLSDEAIITNILSDEEEGIKAFYYLHKEEFISWLRKGFSTDSEEGEEIFQASIVTLIENIKSGKLSSMTSSLKTYFFSIGKNKARDYLRKKRRNSQFDFTRFVVLGDDEDDRDSKIRFEERLDRVIGIIKSLGVPCYPLLTLFYFERKNWHDISELLGYKDENSAKNMKYKCMKKIRRSLNLE